MWVESYHCSNTLAVEVGYHAGILCTAPATKVKGNVGLPSLRCKLCLLLPPRKMRRNFMFSDFSAIVLLSREREREKIERRWCGESCRQPASPPRSRNYNQRVSMRERDT